jgi:hypothetical protein
VVPLLPSVMAVLAAADRETLVVVDDAPVAVASTMFWGVLSLSLALLMVTVKPSSNSTSRSLATVMLMVWVVSLAAKDRVPAGAAAEVGGVGGAGAASGDGPIHRGGLADEAGAGDREGVGGVAALASALSASVATMEKPCRRW